MNVCTGRRPRPFPTHGTHSAPSNQALVRRNALVETHRHLVQPVAHHYWLRCPEPRDDLIQVGLLGLIRAAELYRPETQTPFPAFARPHIRGAILHYLRDDAAPVRLPRRQAELQIRLQRLEEETSANSKVQSSSDLEICRRLEMSAEQWQLLQRHRRLCRPAPLDAALLDQISSPAVEPQEELHSSDLRVDALLQGLDPRTQQVVRWVVLEGWSYRRTAAALNVSAMTVQRWLQRGLANLRDQLSTPHLAPCPSPAPQRGHAPSAAQGWSSRHSQPPAGAPTHRARR